MKIIIVEDNHLTAKTLQLITTDLGHDCLAIFRDAETLIESIESYSPDLLLLDITLEGEMSGLDAAESLRKKMKAAIVFISAHTDPETRSRIDEIDCSFLVSKPFNESIISNALDKVQNELIL